MQVNVQYASEHLEELLSRADRGELIEIIRDGRVFAKLITMPPVEARKVHDAEERKLQSMRIEGKQEELAAE